MHIVMASPEVTPYSKTGGLADATSALAKELANLGHEVKIFSPLYLAASENNDEIENTGLKFKVSLGRRDREGEIWKKGNFYFIRNDHYFLREGLYGANDREYEDNAERFIFFSRAVLEAIKIMGVKTDIVHCHDWQSALVPLYLKYVYSDCSEMKDAVSVFTIHNLAYQGLFPRETMDIMGISPDFFSIEALEFYGKVSFIKGGLIFADVLTTVSKKYSREIQEKEMGCGLEGVLIKRKKDLYGIANGIDYEEWNPATDKYLPFNYDSGDLSGKKKCKDKLKKVFNLPDLGDLPIIGMISRLDLQKGFEIILKSEEKLASLPLQMVFLGNGSEKIRCLLEKVAKRHPNKFAVFIGYNEPLAHLIEAGSDIYLMPSKYEPCGLNHLYSLKYGTIPVVRATGGLDDAIVNFNRKSGRGNGFKFKTFSSRALMAALNGALDLYMNNKGEWERLQKAAMAEDHSWNDSAHKYERLYKTTLERK